MRREKDICKHVNRETRRYVDMEDEKLIFTVAVVFSQTLFCLVFLADEDKNLFDLSGFQRILESF